MAGPTLRHARVAAQLNAVLGPRLHRELGRSQIQEIAERLAQGERVTIREHQPVMALMLRHGISRSAAYRLLEKYAAKDEDRHWVLDESAALAIREDLAVRRARRMMLRLLVKGQLIEGLGPKSQRAAERWLQRHWKPEREKLRVEMPSPPIDTRAPGMLEKAVAELEALNPDLERRAGAVVDVGRRRNAYVMPSQALPMDNDGR